MSQIPAENWESILIKFRDKIVYVKVLVERIGFIYLDGAFRF